MMMTTRGKLTARVVPAHRAWWPNLISLVYHCCHSEEEDDEEEEEEEDEEDEDAEEEEDEEAWSGSESEGPP